MDTDCLLGILLCLINWGYLFFQDFVEKIIGPREHDVWFGLRQNPDNPADWQWTDNSSPGPLDPSLV